MYYIQLDKYISLLSSLIDVMIYDSNNVTNVYRNIINSDGIDKYCITTDKYEIEKFTTIKKNGFSISFLDDKYLYQLIYFNSGSIILNKDNLVYTYHLTNIEDEECIFLINTIRDMMNKISIINCYPNKHK